MTIHPQRAVERTVSRRRLTLVAAAATLAAVDLAAKAIAESRLVDTSVDLRLIELQLGYNSGVAFGLGNTLPAWSVALLTAAIIAGLAVYAWRAVPNANRWQASAGAAILGGAVANLIDRIPDGRVTDHLHTGWWPTFNLADVYISIGAIALIWGSLRNAERTEQDSWVDR